MAVTQERGCGGEVLVAGPVERSGLLGASARVGARVRGLGYGSGRRKLNGPAGLGAGR